MHEPMVQRADFDQIVWLIVVGFTLVSQMVRAAKKKPQQKQPPPAAQIPPKPRPPRRRVAVRQPVATRKVSPPAPPKRPTDLQTILEQLARREMEVNAPEQNVSEPPERIDDPLVGADPDTAEVEIKRPPPAPAPVMRIAPEPPPATAPRYAPILESKVDPYALGRRTAAESALVSLRHALRADIQEHAAQRKAILLREILDPPLALRPASSGR